MDESVINVRGLADEDIKFIRKIADTLRQKNRPGINTEKFLKLCGSWEDNRTPEEIIGEIYKSRTTGKGEVGL